VTAVVVAPSYDAYVAWCERVGHHPTMGGVLFAVDGIEYRDMDMLIVDANGTVVSRSPRHACVPLPAALRVST
jgi:hypothetical protein